MTHRDPNETVSGLDRQPKSYTKGAGLLGAVYLAAFDFHAGPAAAVEGCGGGTSAPNFECNLIIT